MVLGLESREGPVLSFSGPASAEGTLSAAEAGACVRTCRPEHQLARLPRGTFHFYKKETRVWVPAPQFIPSGSKRF